MLRVTLTGFRILDALGFLEFFKPTIIKPPLLNQDIHKIQPNLQEKPKRISLISEIRLCVAMQR